MMGVPAVLTCALAHGRLQPTASREIEGILTFGVARSQRLKGNPLGRHHSMPCLMTALDLLV